MLSKIIRLIGLLIVAIVFFGLGWFGPEKAVAGGCCTAAQISSGGYACITPPDFLVPSCGEQGFYCYCQVSGEKPNPEWHCPSGTHLEYSDPPEFYKNGVNWCLYKAACQPPPGSVITGEWPYYSGPTFSGCRVQLGGPLGDSACYNWKPGTAYCQACSCVPDCNVTAPYGLTILWLSPTSARMSWTNGTGGSSVLVRVDEDLAEVNAGCPTPGDCEVNKSFPIGTTTYTANNLQPSTIYYFRVVNFASASCYSGIVLNSLSPSPSVIEGTVYNDVDGICGGNPSTFGGMAVTYDPDPPGNPVYADAVSTTDGRYSITNAPVGVGSLSLTGLPAGYNCTPGCSGCVQGSVFNPPGGERNFYITQSRGAWWQLVGAGAYAGSPGPGLTIKSDLPTGATNLVIPGTNDLAALVHSGSSAPDLGDLGGKVSTKNWKAQSEYHAEVTDYDFFASQIGVTSSTNDYWGGASALNTPGSVEEFYYTRPNTGKTAITSSWDLNAGDSFVILVDGNLDIEADIVVEPGEFLAFIVSGSVQVGPGVSTIQGVYVMDGNFVTEVDSDQLDVQGTVATWSGVILQRDLGSLNLTTPAERFTYRPDFIVNMPSNMRIFNLNWQEVSPGTFGE